MQDRELARRAQQGDIDAYEARLRTYQSGANRAAFLILRHREEAEDAVQEAFIRAWDHIDSFDANRDFRPWLTKIVINEARDRLRKQSRLKRLKLQISHHLLVRADQQSPEDEVIRQERIHALLEELDRMSEPVQQVMVLRFFLDLPTAEIAEIMELPGGTVRSHISRARTQLRRRLATINADSQTANNREQKNNG